MPSAHLKLLAWLLPELYSTQSHYHYSYNGTFWKLKDQNSPQTGWNIFILVWVKPFYWLFKQCVNCRSSQALYVSIHSALTQNPELAEFGLSAQLNKECQITVVCALHGEYKKFSFPPHTPLTLGELVSAPKPKVHAKNEFYGVKDRDTSSLKTEKSAIKVHTNKLQLTVTSLGNRLFLSFPAFGGLFNSSNLCSRRALKSSCRLI